MFSLLSEKVNSLISLINGLDNPIYKLVAYFTLALAIILTLYLIFKGIKRLINLCFTKKRKMPKVPIKKSAYPQENPNLDPNNFIQPPTEKPTPAKEQAVLERLEKTLADQSASEPVHFDKLEVNIPSVYSETDIASQPVPSIDLSHLQDELSGKSLDELMTIKKKLEVSLTQNNRKLNKSVGDYKNQVKSRHLLAEKESASIEKYNESAIQLTDELYALSSHREQTQSELNEIYSKLSSLIEEKVKLLECVNLVNSDIASCASDAEALLEQHQTQSTSNTKLTKQQTEASSLKASAISLTEKREKADETLQSLFDSISEAKLTVANEEGTLNILNTLISTKEAEAAEARRQEELRLAEIRRQEELKRQQEEKARAEQLAAQKAAEQARKQEEALRKEEERKQEQARLAEMRHQEELKRQQEEKAKAEQLAAQKAAEQACKQEEEQKRAENHQAHIPASEPTPTVSSVPTGIEGVDEKTLQEIARAKATMLAQRQRRIQEAQAKKAAATNNTVKESVAPSDTTPSDTAQPVEQKPVPQPEPKPVTPTPSPKPSPSSFIPTVPDEIRAEWAREAELKAAFKKEQEEKERQAKIRLQQLTEESTSDQ